MKPLRERAQLIISLVTKLLNFGHGLQPVMILDEILVVELSMMRQMMGSPNQEHTILNLTELARWLEWPNPFIWLTMSSHDTNGIFPDSILQIAHVANKYPTIFHIKGARKKMAENQLY